MKTLQINKNKLKANVAKVRDRAGNVLVYGVLKGNGYGLGLLKWQSYSGVRDNQVCTHRW